MFQYEDCGQNNVETSYLHGNSLEITYDPAIGRIYPVFPAEVLEAIFDDDESDTIIARLTLEENSFNQASEFIVPLGSSPNDNRGVQIINPVLERDCAEKSAAFDVYNDISDYAKECLFRGDYLAFSQNFIFVEGARIAFDRKILRAAYSTLKMYPQASYVVKKQIELYEKGAYGLTVKPRNGVNLGEFLAEKSFHGSDFVNYFDFFLSSFYNSYNKDDINKDDLLRSPTGVKLDKCMAYHWDYFHMLITVALLSLNQEGFTLMKKNYKDNASQAGFNTGLSLITKFELFQNSLKNLVLNPALSEFALVSNNLSLHLTSSPVESQLSLMLMGINTPEELARFYRATKQLKNIPSEYQDFYTLLYNALTNLAGAIHYPPFLDDNDLNYIFQPFVRTPYNSLSRSVSLLSVDPESLKSKVKDIHSYSSESEFNFDPSIVDWNCFNMPSNIVLNFLSNHRRINLSFNYNNLDNDRILSISFSFNVRDMQIDWSCLEDMNEYPIARENFLLILDIILEHILESLEKQRKEECVNVPTVPLPVRKISTIIPGMEVSQQTSHKRKDIRQAEPNTSVGAIRIESEPTSRSYVNVILGLKDLRDYLASIPLIYHDEIRQKLRAFQTGGSVEATPLKGKIRGRKDQKGYRIKAGRCRIILVEASDRNERGRRFFRIESILKRDDAYDEIE